MYMDNIKFEARDFLIFYCIHKLSNCLDGY